MTASRVQIKTNTSATSTVSVGSGQGWATPSANHLLIAAVLSFVGGAATMTGWTLATSDAFDGGTKQVDLFYKISDGTESTVTATKTSATVMQIVVDEWTGMLTSSPLDKIANDGSNSAATVTSRATGTTAATSQANELAIVVVGLGNTSSAQSWTNSFVTEASPTRMYYGDKTLAATGTQTSTASWTTARTAGGLVATFKIAPPAAPPVQPPTIRRALMRSR